MMLFYLKISSVAHTVVKKGDESTKWLTTNSLQGVFFHLWSLYEYAQHDVPYVRLYSFLLTMWLRIYKHSYSIYILLYLFWSFNCVFGWFFYFKQLHLDRMLEAVSSFESKLLFLGLSSFTTALSLFRYSHAWFSLIICSSRRCEFKTSRNLASRLNPRRKNSGMGAFCASRQGAEYLLQIPRGQAVESMP